MFCSNCGSKLKDEAKFCGNCGTKAEKIDSLQEDSEVVKKIEIAPLPLSYKNLDIEITDVSAEGPDSDGDMRLTVKYAVTNNTDNDWEFYETRCQLFSANGLIVDETRDTSEMTISTGDTEDLEASFWSIKAHALGAHPEKAHVVITFTASEFAQQKLGEVKIPENPFEMVSIKPAKIDNLLSLVSCSLWKTEPDSDKDCRVEIKALIQNHTLLHLPEVKMLATITDAKGREVTDASCYEEMRPAALAVISGSGYTKEKKLVGANAELTLRAYWPVAVGVDQLQGLSISNIESDMISHHASNSSEHENNYIKNSGTTQNILYFYSKWTVLDAENSEPEDIIELTKLLSAMRENEAINFIQDHLMVDVKGEMQSAKELGIEIANIAFNDNIELKHLEFSIKSDIAADEYTNKYGESVYMELVTDNFVVPFMVYESFSWKDKSSETLINEYDENGAPKSDKNRSKNFSNMKKLEFQIKRGVVDMDSIDDDVKDTVEKCLNLCKEKRHEEAVRLLLPVINFEWIWGNCDGDPTDIFETSDDVSFDLNSDNSIVQVGESDGSLVITATAYFNLYAKDGVTDDQISEWLSDNSAYACGYIGAGWIYIESDGDNVWLVNN